MRVAVAASALLAVAGLAAFWYASGEAKKAPAKAADSAVTVTIQGNACEPNEITVRAGRTTLKASVWAPLVDPKALGR